MFFKITSFTLLLWLAHLPVMAQMTGIFIDKKSHKAEIPFELHDNFIIVNVVFENVFPLRFIFDTGAEYTILAKKEIATSLNVPFDRSIMLMGTDMRTQMQAYIARRIRLKMPNLILVKDILVLEDDFLQLEKFVGLDVHGILGVEAFKGYIVKIDYVKKIITLYDPSVFGKADHRKYEELPIEIIRSKPYLTTEAQIQTDSSVSLKLLIDTGAGLSLLLHTYSTPGLVMPKTVIRGNLGTGMGGIIEGFVGRIKTLKIGSLRLNSPVCNFQELLVLSDSSYLNRRNGLLGSEILSRLNIIIDFPREKIYFQPNSSFNQSFTYDRSGLQLIAHGELLNRFIVQYVLDNSPAHEAGIQVGDELLKINGLQTSFYNLGTLNNMFHKRVGKKIKLTVLRNNRKIKYTFHLRDLI